MQHLTPEFRVRRMHRNIDWGKLIVNNPPDIFFFHVCECHIISLQKRQTRIIILKINRFPHAWWVLVDKTEYAFVKAASVFIHQRFAELHTEVFIVIFFDF